MIDAPGFHRLTTALYFEGDPYVSSDVTFGVKKSLVVVSLHHPLAVVARVLLIRVITRACPP
jgi:protocatechuate 3,4-dioxygenase beta subunit